MAFEVGEVVGGSDGFYSFDDFALGKRGEGLSVVGLAGKDVSVMGWIIDTLMVFKGLPWVGWARLLGP